MHERASSAPSLLPALAGRRIAVVNWKDPWHPEAGGAEEYAWRIAGHLTEAGASVTFATARAPGQARREARDGIAIARGGGRWTVYLWALWWLLRRRGEFDAVVDCQNGIPFFAPWVLRRRTPVVCVIHHVHDRQFELHFGPLLARVGKALEGPVARRAYRRAVTVAVSPSTVSALRERLAWRGPIALVPNGLTVRPVAADRTRSEQPRLLCVGRLAVHKRVEVLLDVVEQLLPRWPSLQLDIVGDGPGLAALREAVAARGLGGAVSVHGFLPAAERDAHVAGAWLHISASHGEGWGLVVLEAAHQGLPTVAYDVDGLRDAVRDGETGWLVAAGEQLAEVVDKALTTLADPLAAEGIAGECRRWSAGFDWASSGRRFANVLADLLEPPTIAWGEETAVLEITTDSPDELRFALPSLLGRRQSAIAGGPGLRMLVSAVRLPEVLAVLAQDVSVRSAEPVEVLRGVPL